MATNKNNILNKIRPVPNQKVITIRKMHPKGIILDVKTNKQAMSELSVAGYEMYMYFVLNVPGYTEALSVEHVTTTTGLSEKTYYKAINELISVGYLVKEPHEKFKEYYVFYESKKEQQKIIDTQMLIDKYILVQDYQWEGGRCGSKELLSIVEQFNQPGIDNDAISDVIKTLLYGDFLNTPYWRAIAYYKKKQVGFKCQYCNSNENLATHHKDYSIHGQEHKYDIIKNFLEVMCKKCHNKEHNL